MADHHVDENLPSSAAQASHDGASPIGRWLAASVEHPKGPAAWLVALVFVATLVFWFLDLSATFDPPYLILALNSVFIGIGSVLIAAMGIRAFLRSGSWPALLLGAGAFTFGVATVAAGWVLALAGPNVAITIHNTIALLAAALHALGAFFVVNGVAPQARKGGRLSTLLQIYAGSLAIMLFVIVRAAQGVTPPFFVAGAGGTPIRQTVVTVASLLFFGAGLVYLSEYRRSRAAFLYWYALGLLLISLCMAGILMITATGTPLNWMGRIAQLLGGVYLLMAAVITVKEARARNLRPSDVLASFFWRDEANLKLLFESISDATIVTDQRFIITDWNRAAEQVYGWMDTEVIGKPVADVLGTQYPSENDRQVAQEALLGRGTWKGEVLQRRRDGSVIPVLATVSALKDAEGRAVGAVAVNHDITERKRSEEALRESEANLQRRVAEQEAILNAIADGLVVYDGDGRIVRQNAVARELLGYTPDTQELPIAERGPKVIQPLKGDGTPFTPDEYPATRALRGEVVRNQDMILHVPARGGGPLRMSVSSAPIQMPDGTITGCVTTFTDTEAYHQANERLAQAAEGLQRANAELQAILSAIPVALIVYDPGGKIVHINDIAMQMLGYREDTWKLPVQQRVGTSVQAFWPDGRLCERAEYVAVRAAAGEVVQREEYFVHLPERPEKDFWGLFSAGPIVGPDGKKVGSVVTWAETTTLRQTNKQLEAQADELRLLAETLDQRVQERTIELAQANAELSRSREQMQGLSHRLIEAVEEERRHIALELHDQANQLLTSLMLGLSILEKRYESSDEARRHIAYLHGIGDSLSRCMHDLAVSLRPASLDRLGLAPALKQLVEMFQSNAHIQVDLVATGLHERLGPEMETAIYRIVQESLTNVVRHSGATRAGVVVQRRDDHVTAIIEDDGKGFTVDWALNSGRLGLSGMRERAEMLGGTLTIETKPGSGTTVFAELPWPAQR